MSDYSHLVGHRFPGGHHTLASYEAWLWDDSVASTPEPAAAHPGVAYAVGLHGGGASIQDIMDLFGTSNDAGVMMAGVEFEFAGTLTPGASYEVEGEVTSVERKAGKRAGAFDLVGFEHRLFDGGDRSPVAVVQHAWVIPRQGEEGGDA